ncbi:MAG: hypothetical protein AAFQ68_08170 [Bacteroidota bacterium]
MIYRTLALILGLSSSFFLSAQDVEWSGDYRKARPNSNVTQILGEDEDHIYGIISTRIYDENEAEQNATATNRNRDRSSIIKFSKNLVLKKEAPLVPKLGKKKMEFQFAERLGDEMFVFSTVIDRKSRENVLMAQQIDKKNLSLSKKPQRVAFTNIRNARNIGTFSYQLSRKRSKLLLVGYEPYKRGENEKFNLSVYDRGLEQVWERQITIPYEDQLFFIERFVIDDRGDVYVLGRKYYDRPKNRRRGRPNYSYVILAYRFKGLEFEEYEVKLKDRFITDLSFTVNDTGDLICAGLYSDRGTVSIKGTYFMSVDAISQEIKEEGFKEFDDDFLTQFMNDRQAERGRELYDYKLDEIILRADGGAILIAEQYFVDVYTYTNPDGTIQTRNYYNYNDIIVININPNKTIEWATKVPKRQVTVDDFGYFSSFAHAITDQNIYLIFNDNQRNMTKERRNPLSFNGSRSVVMLVAIDTEGRVSKEILTSNREERIITRPKSCEQLGRNRMIVYGSRGKKYKLGEVLLE